MSIVLVGADAALLEGVAQALAAAGLRPQVLASLAEARAAAAPLVLVVERGLVLTRGTALPPIAAGGAVLLYHAPDGDEPALSHRLQRAILADVALPLERHRLVALVQRVLERHRATGREHPRASADEDDRPPL